jgi:uncharacterized membrane protein HdeD (DUF308 family)
MNMNSETTVNEEKTAKGWSMVWGLIMIMSGLLAIALPLATSIGIVLVLGWLISLSAVAHLIFAFHSHSIGGVIWKLLLAVFYGSTGFYMVAHPILGVATVTTVLAIFLFCEGVVEIAFYFHIRRAANALWVLFDGIVTLILGYLIWAQWPSNLGWVLGTLIGISLLFSGISRFMLSRAFPRLPLS